MTYSESKLAKKVDKEARVLLREARKGLGRYGFKLGPAVRDAISQRIDTLARARERGDQQAIRAALLPLDELVDEHMSMARKSPLREYTESIGIAVLIAILLRGFVVEAFKIPSGSMLPTMEIGDHIFVNKVVYGMRVPFTTTKLFGWRSPERGEVIVFINPCTPDKDYIKRVVAVANDTVEVRCDQLYINGERVPTRYVDDEGRCEHWDLNSRLGEDWNMESCSLYRETLGDHTYDVIHPPNRPEILERLEAGDRPNGVELGYQDFPTNRGVPECAAHEDQRGPDVRERSRGRIELSIPERDNHEGPCAPVRRYVVPDGHVFAMGDNRDNSHDSRTWGSVPTENIKGKALFIWWSKKPGEQGGIHWKRMGQIVK
jgi:signal peptidase I